MRFILIPVIVLFNFSFVYAQEEVFVPYHTVEEPPVFSGCEEIDTYQIRACFFKKIGEYIQDNIP